MPKFLKKIGFNRDKLSNGIQVNNTKISDAFFLPIDVLLLIFLKLDQLSPALLCQLGLVSKCFNIAANQNILWKQFINAEVNIAPSNLSAREFFIRHPDKAIEKYSIFNKNYKIALVEKLLCHFKEKEAEWKSGNDNEISVHDFLAKHAKEFSLDNRIVMLRSLNSIFNLLKDRPKSTSFNYPAKLYLPFYARLQKMIKYGGKNAAILSPGVLEKINNYFSATENDYKISVVIDALVDKRLIKNPDLSIHLDTMLAYMDATGVMSPLGVDSKKLVDRVLRNFYASSPIKRLARS